MNNDSVVASKAFRLLGHETIRGFFPDPDLGFIADYAFSRDTGQLHDPVCPNTPSFYADPVMELLLVRFLPRLEAITELSLYPTYSYFRNYKRGDALPRHKDRPSCEISVSLCLGGEYSSSWPLSLDANGSSVCVHLEPGDALLYRGCEFSHWRDKFEGYRMAQVFLHYVDANGPNAEWKFDKRPSINA